MTCIAGFVEGDRVWIGGDSAASHGMSIHIRAEPKVFRNGSLLIGFSQSFRMGQVLRHILVVPEHDPTMTVEQYASTALVDAIQAALSDAGVTCGPCEYGAGNILIGYAGNLFFIDHDFQVGFPIYRYYAIGSGQDIALGALYASGRLQGEERLTRALGAAVEFNASCRGPFTIDSI